MEKWFLWQPTSISLVCIILEHSIFAVGELPQCFAQECQLTLKNGTNLAVPCEPRNENLNLAVLGTIDISPQSGTCGNPPQKFCDLNNPTRCRTCDASRRSLSHPTEHMVNGVKWKWWQSVVFADDQSPEINVTINLPKLFILTDDIQIFFSDGRPQKMMIEKSSDFGKSWSVMEYYSDDCRKDFGLEHSDNLDVLPRKNAFQPICSEEYSRNRDQLDSMASVDISRRLFSLFLSEAELCAALMRSSSSLKSFLHITNLRIRLLRPPILNSVPGTPRKIANRSRHYGIDTIRISARCECNGHAGSYAKNGDIHHCLCRHNTDGLECEKCKTLYWMRKWKPGQFSSNRNDPGQANKCEGILERYAERRALYLRHHAVAFNYSCNCNRHSERCEVLTGFGNTCVDCRHNTEGRNCYYCRQEFYKRPNTSLDDPDICKACSCHPQGSRSLWCQPSGRCRCRIPYTGRKCNRCLDGYHSNERQECLSEGQKNEITPSLDPPGGGMESTFKSSWILVTWLTLQTILFNSPFSSF
ncbi:netrin-G1-like isoform X1 [Clavelina lepadiformis]|uniref:netrin-G1-like isoform X1 n=1 Tax=Clavelina lepadiformis TaxID=159417 RepID=UPI0040424C65